MDGLIGPGLLSLITNRVTWTGSYGSNLAMVLSDLGWTAAEFDALKFGIMKQNGTQQTYLGNILAEVLYN
jgi:hypothetical protein